MNSDVVQAAYTPIARLQCYGMEADFGEYHKETGELKILDRSMISSDVDVEKLKEWLDERNRKGDLYGYHLIFNIPKDVYHLRQKVQRGEVSDEIR